MGVEKSNIRVCACVCTYTAQVGDCVIKIQSICYYFYKYCTYIHIFMQFITVYLALQVKNKQYYGVAKCVFILLLGMVTNNMTKWQSTEW